jgi:hypothetical protein
MPSSKFCVASGPSVYSHCFMDRPLESDKHTSLWPVALLASALGLCAWLKIKPIDPKPEEKYPRENRPHEKKPVPPTGVMESKTIKTETHKNGTQPKRGKVHPYLKVGVNVLTLVAVTWYACEAKKQRVAMEDTFKEVQKQTTLQRQQLIGTQGATIEAEIEATASDAVHFLLVNHGLVTANALHVKAEASKVRFTPAYGTIEGPELLFSRRFAPVRAGQPALNEPYALPHGWALEQDWKHFFQQGKTIQITLDISYESGFGDPGELVHLSVCKTWLPRNNGPYGLIPCDDFMPTLRNGMRTTMPAN